MAFENPPAARTRNALNRHLAPHEVLMIVRGRVD